MASSSTGQEKSELKKGSGSMDLGFFDLPHINSLDCWCDPIAQYAEGGRVFVLIHQCPTSQ